MLSTWCTLAMDRESNDISVMVGWFCHGILVGRVLSVKLLDATTLARIMKY